MPVTPWTVQRVLQNLETPGVKAFYDFDQFLDILLPKDWQTGYKAVIDTVLADDFLQRALLDYEDECHTDAHGRRARLRDKQLTVCCRVLGLTRDALVEHSVAFKSSTRLMMGSRETRELAYVLRSHIPPPALCEVGIGQLMNGTLEDGSSKCSVLFSKDGMSSLLDCTSRN